MTRKEFLLLSKGDKIRIADKWPENPLNVWRNSEGLMDKWLGKEVTVHDVLNDFVRIVEDKGCCEFNDSGHWAWHYNMLEHITEDANSEFEPSSDIDLMSFLGA